jgi:uncharacterized protein YajQ (UPF0234 family)
MSKLQNKFFAAIDVIETTILCPLKSQILEQIETSNESEIDKILSESEYRLNFVHSILQQKMVTIANIDQQATLPLQKQMIPDVFQEPVKLERSQSEKTGKKKSTVAKSATTQSAKKKTSKKTVTEDEITQIVERLKNVTSREEGRTIIDEINYTVKQLELLAKHLGISKIKGLNKNDLIEKIIQETIGYLIDSATIQGHK